MHQTPRMPRRSQARTTAKWCTTKCCIDGCCRDIFYCRVRMRPRATRFPLALFTLPKIVHCLALTRTRSLCFTALLSSPSSLEPHSGSHHRSESSRPIKRGSKQSKAEGGGWVKSILAPVRPLLRVATPDELQHRSGGVRNSRTTASRACLHQPASSGGSSLQPSQLNRMRRDYSVRARTRGGCPVTAAVNQQNRQGCPL